MEEIHLNYTRFLDKDNGRVWWPNRVLRDTPFINLSASGGHTFLNRMFLDFGKWRLSCVLDTPCINLAASGG